LHAPSSRFLPLRRYDRIVARGALIEDKVGALAKLSRDLAGAQNAKRAASAADRSVRPLAWLGAPR